MFHDDPQDPLCKAAKFVDQAIGVDNNFLDLAALLGIDSINEPTIGGCEPIEYPSTSFQVPELAPLKIKMLPIELQERLKQFQCNCQMGIFTEIGRAWLTIDNELYLWTYDDGSDIAYYDGLNEVILCVALVRPKPNIFQSPISHLLCITTPIEVVLLGVTFAVASGTDNSATTSYNDLQILQEPLFALATDNVHMTSIIGTNDGRIFMSGKDGCLYEMHYQGDLGWLGRRSCRLINHSTSFSSYILPSFMSSYFSKEDPLVQLCYDDSRKILIARSLKSCLQLFYLGPQGNKLNKIGHSEYEKTLKKVSKNFDKTRLGSIVHVAPVPASDSERIHLVATTNTGFRLYYTTWDCSDNLQQMATSPDCLALVHVRNPPNLGGSASPHRLPRSSLFPSGQLNDVHLAAYSQGTHLMSSAGLNDDGDMLCTFSHDSFPFINVFGESYESTQLAGKVWDIREVQIQDAQIKDLIRDPAMPQSPVFPDPPAIVTQHYLGNKKFAIVSSVGVCIAMKLSPCEQLQQLLMRNSVDSEPVKAYFRLMKEQAMTSCLALMCSKNSMHLQVNSIATRAYNIYKWEASFGQVLVPEQTSTPIAGQLRRNANFQQISGIPHSTSPLTSHFDFSNTSLNHRSLYLYLARILRPVWCHKVVTTVPDPETKGTFLTSRLNSEQILLVLQKCQDFLLLLRNHPSILAHVPCSNPGVSIIMPDSFSLSRNMSLRGMDFEADEMTSLRNLESLLDISCQCLSMWKILADHQFHIVAARLKQEDRDALICVSFSQLILSNRNLCKQLITTLVDFYIDDNAITDVISLRLRESCPLLYSSQDQAQTKGNECLKLAKIASNPLEKRKLILNAVQQYKVTINSAVPSSIHQQHNASVADLPSMCTRLASVGAYLGLVDLALAAASKRDPNNVAQHFYLCSKPPEDVEGAKLFAIRSECYKPIVESLDYLCGLCSQDSESKGREGFGKLISSIIPSFFSSSAGDKDLVSPLTNGYMMTSEEANNQMEEMVHMIMKSEDQMAHFALFDWMNGKGLSDKLLDLPSPYLEQYLKLESDFDCQHQPQQQQQQIKQKDMLDLLANYYIKEKKFSLAARILDKLAMKAGNHMSLKERHKYMSKAVVCLQSSVSRADSEFMHEVQDKVEVILLQLKVMKELEQCTGRPERMIEDAVLLLDTQLFDVSKLYADFSIPFELPVCKLAIVRSTGIREANLINSIWREIIDKEVKLSVGQDPQQRMEIIAAHFLTIGKDYLKEEIYFPLPFLVMHLEQVSITEGFCKVDVTFVAKSLLEIGVSAQQLHDVYEMLFRQKDSFWKNQKQQYHLVEVDIFIMKQVIDALPSSFYVQHNRRQMLNRCLDGISFYLVELQSDSGRNEQIVNSLREIQIKMERLDR